MKTDWRWTWVFEEKGDGHRWDWLSWLLHTLARKIQGVSDYSKSNQVWQFRSWMPPPHTHTQAWYWILVSSLWCYWEAVEPFRGGPSGRKSDHWGHTCEKGIRTTASSCFSLCLSAMMRWAALVHPAFQTFMICLITGSKAEEPIDDHGLNPLKLWAKASPSSF